MSTIKVDKLQGTSGSATALTLNGAASTFNGVHTVGNNAIYTSEGGAVTQNLVQGLAKAYLTYNNAGSIQDSFNIGSVTDAGTGEYVTVFTNNLSNANYVTAGTTIGGTGNQSVLDAHQTNGVKGTTGYEVGTSDNNNSDSDNTKCQTVDFGDLA